MSTHRNILALRRGTGRSACSLLGGLLLALQLVVPAVAFAASIHTGQRADPPQALAQAEVSVVRLVSDYTA